MTGRWVPVASAPRERWLLVDLGRGVAVEDRVWALWCVCQWLAPRPESEVP